MTLKSTKVHLIELLADPDNRVVALSGKWGTGKSHLWREVRDGSQDDEVKNALYVSLFGLSDMNQIKLKIVQSALPCAETTPGFWDGASKTVNAIKKGLEGFNKGFSALSDLALLAVPAILKNKVIVLDDIERKHEKLSIDEVMGFIDEFTQQHGARIVLILNSDQLADRSMWDKLREKVVDQEIRLDTSPAEAFEIAQSLSSSVYADRIKTVVETCGLTNIRIIRKVIRAVNRILANREGLSDDVLGRVIPSTVVLSAIHYKGIEDAPDFDFVLKIANPPPLGDRGKKQDELDEIGKREAKWRLMLQELDINGCDEYEHLVVEYLKSGLFDVAEVAKIIDRYIAEAKSMRTHHLARQLHEQVIWHYKMTEEQLLAEARNLVDTVHLLDAYSVTSLHQLVSGLSAGAAVADSMIDKWIQAFQVPADEEFDGENFWGRPLHPRIKAVFQATKASARAKTTIFDACYRIAKHKSWGHKEEAVMKGASAKDFEATIKSLDTTDLRLFMCRLLDMCIHRETYVTHFGSAMDNFVLACRAICDDPGSGRLAALIRLLFKDAKLELDLAPKREQAPAAQAAPAAS